MNYYPAELFWPAVKSQTQERKQISSDLENESLKIHFFLICLSGLLYSLYIWDERCFLIFSCLHIQQTWNNFITMFLTKSKINYVYTYILV